LFSVRLLFLLKKRDLINFLFFERIEIYLGSFDSFNIRDEFRERCDLTVDIDVEGGGW
jgi:hypothetical protein